VATKSDTKQAPDHPHSARWWEVTRSRSQDPLRETRQGFIASLAMTLRLAILGCALAACSACSGRVPHPPAASQPSSALVEVDYPPPPARVEFVTPQPAGNAVWLNGEWSWTGRRWSWKPGGWVVVPEGAAYARLALVRRADGKLFSAPGTWRNANGEEVAAPEFMGSSSSKSSAVVDPEGDPAPTGPDLRGDGGGAARGPERSQEESAPSRPQPKEEEGKP
jgi:hypothetical protein